MDSSKADGGKEIFENWTLTIIITLHEWRQGFLQCIGSDKKTWLTITMKHQHRISSQGVTCGRNYSSFNRKSHSYFLRVQMVLITCISFNLHHCEDGSHQLTPSTILDTLQLNWRGGKDYLNSLMRQNVEFFHDSIKKFVLHFRNSEWRCTGTAKDPWLTIMMKHQHRI